MSKKSSVPTKRFRDYEVSGRNRCQQTWASTYYQSACYNASVRKFMRVRNYLNIDTEVEIGDKDSNVELHNSYCYTRKIKNTTSLNYQVDIHKGDTQSNIPNDGVARISSDVSSNRITQSKIPNDSKAHNLYDVSNNTITQSNIPNDSKAHNSSDVSNNTITQPNIHNDRKAHNSSIHPPQSPSTHAEPVVTTTLAPNPPTVSCPIAEPQDKLEGNHFEHISNLHSLGRGTNQK